jgi:hypothetical protein
MCRKGYITTYIYLSTLVMLLLFRQGYLRVQGQHAVSLIFIMFDNLARHLQKGGGNAACIALKRWI